jgi:glucuronokinase
LAVDATAYARAGLLGNPSDGYFGKTISATVRNFAAKVSVYEAPELEIIPSVRDRSRYQSLRDLVEDVRAYGYYGGIRLMKAAIRGFVDFCDEQGYELPERNFSIRYRSNIPRHVGLAGSSALVTAAIRCLMEHYEVDISNEVLPNLILAVEREQLGISAGLQDRVIQVYQDCVYMDFNRAQMEKSGHGVYEPIDPDLLPPLFVAYRTDFSEGSEVFHNRIRERWERGEPQVVEAMERFAGFAEQARELLLAGRGMELGDLMNANFDLRCSLYNLSPADIDMVERARAAGASAKFCGSGGAIVGVCPDDATFERLRETYEGTSVQVLRPRITDFD